MRVDGELFVGRAAELEQILTIAGRLGDGLQSVLVAGPAGIGKTALLQQVAGELAGCTVLWAVGDSWERLVPYGVISQLLAPVRPAHGAGHTLLFGPADENVEPHRVGAELVELVGELAAASPVAIIVDDVAAADDLSLRALAYAVRRLRNTAVLLLVTARPQAVVNDPAVTARSERTERAGWTDRMPDWRPMLPADTVELHLGELSRAEVGQMAHGNGVAWLPPNKLDWLTRYTGGHPHYLRELLAEMEPARLLADAGRSVTVPSPVVQAISRQVQALPWHSARLLEALAVLNGRFPLAVAAKLADADAPDEALAPLLAENLVRSWPHSLSTPVRIRYPIQRDAIYETITPSRRRRLHAAALHWSHGRAAWAHRVAASDRIDVNLAAELEAAAHSVLHEGKPARAATFLLWAADLSGLPPDRERRTLQAAAHLLWNCRFAPADPLFADVENAADSALRSCILARYSMMRGWFSAAESAFRGVLADPGQGSDREWVRALAATGLASLSAWLGRGADTATSARHALAGGNRFPDLSRLARQYLAVAALHTSGPRAAIDVIATELQLPERAGNALPAQADTLSWRSLFRGLHGQLTASIDDAEVVVRLAESGLIASEMEVSPQYCLAWSQYLVGRWGEAATNAEHAISLAAADGKSWAHAYSHMIAALVAAGRGDWLAAEASTGETARWVRTLGPPQYVVFAAMATAALAQARDDHDSVLRALRPLTELVEVTGWPLAYEPWWRILQVEALVTTGQHTPAEQALRRLTGLAAGVPALGPVVAWLGGALAWARGEPRAAELFAAGLQREPGQEVLPLYRARLEEDYGRLLVQTRQWRAGLYRLERAHQAYLAIGATPFAERCALQLSASGVIPQQRVAGPLSLLTERERAIVALVTQGLTNQEVAERLFISAKTVSHHLGRVFAKLGIASRRELRDLTVHDVQPG